jgi:hypothetical protein
LGHSILVIKNVRTVISASKAGQNDQVCNSTFHAITMMGDTPHAAGAIRRTRHMHHRIIFICA